MDRKSILILGACLILFLSWSSLVNRLYPPQPSTGTNTVTTASHQPAVPSTNTPVVPTPVVSAPSSIPSLGEPAAPEKRVTLENDNVRYTFTSHGGGLDLVELKRKPFGCGTGRNGSTNNLDTLNTAAPVPAFTLLGGEALLGDGDFVLERTPAGVRAEKVLSNGLVIAKEFHPGTNYLLSATIRLENRSDQPITIPAQEWVIGTATPMGPRDDAALMGMQWFNGSRAERIGEPWFANRTLGCFPGTPRAMYVGGDSNVVWAAVHNRFFTMIAIPPTNALAPRVIARRVDLPPPTEEEMKADPKRVARPIGFQAALLYPEMVLAPRQKVERRYEVFAGPKEYRTLDRLGAKFGNDVDLVMDFGGFFGYFAKVLLLSMNGLHSFGLSYGLTIIAITIIIKLLFWPLTQASTKSMKRMAALQPQMKAIQEKYKDDPKKMNQKVMEYMKEHKVNPASGCLPILIQIPVFIGFYKMLQSAIELRGARFLWACDLSQPDTVFVIAGLPINPLPLIMGATQLWQIRLTPPSPGMDPVQQKIMQYMPLIFLFILYNFSSGLTLYWTVQNLLTIAQMKLTKTGEAKATAAKTPAAAKPAPPAPRKKK